MTGSERKKIIELIKREVVPAIGCTEPIAVALAAAKAREVLGDIPENIEAYLSPNILKNAMGVGIPGTGMIGLPIAIALGVLIGKSEYQLEVLKESNPEAVEKGKKYIAEYPVHISLKEEVKDKLYIEVLASKGPESARVIIRTTHTNICFIEKDGEIILDKQERRSIEENEDDASLILCKVYDFAMTAPLEEIAFILETGKTNKKAALSAFENDYGHSLGKTLAKESKDNMMGDSLFSHILAYTSAACDARMAGAMIPVVSNSGSGNQGISASLPVLIYAEETGQPEENLIRALILSHLTVIYIKSYLGRLSALCGCVVAATGSACGITYLMGGKYEQISFAVKNMVANLTGMICDGAKPSCALKVCSGVSTAVFSAMMAMDGKTVSSLEGIIDDDVDQSIKNLTLIGVEGMNETDRLILKIMTEK
ncbi:MAG: L-serine ammonia-lyase, iron-sulfur-dependent, subunit alpha [Bacteroidales bacterium]|jgi:L-cysteine desulfidase|nr:L-serine ammonia-lyase, iron-sulfur-dependent, subunit alpha [Bacteroidales bacterium]